MQVMDDELVTTAQIIQSKSESTDLSVICRLRVLP